MVKYWIIILMVHTASTQIYNCPGTWVTYQQHCYYFNYAPQMEYTDALTECNAHGASLLSVNDINEHNFIVQQLRNQDTTGYSWYTSGNVNDILRGDLKWEGDGTNIAFDRQWWFSEEDRLVNQRRIVYKSLGGVYGWSRVPSTSKLPYICEIEQAEAYRINQDDRDFTYGSNISDVTLVPRGPKFVIHPHNLVVVEDTRSISNDDHFTARLECFADGNPLPTYRIFRTSVNGSTIDVTSGQDDRYTIIGGTLVISDPNEDLDGGIYQCEASNIYGTILSERANLTFGVLGSFSNVNRAPVVVKEYESAAIECVPPQFKPAVSYQWTKGPNDFVRPDLNPHTFVSSNGKLYFSEVTQVDVGDYHCIVKLTSGSNAIMNIDQPPSSVSTAIPLVIQHQVPATWGPVIADGFIATFPERPLRGQTVKLECLAYGTLPLTYSWSRKDFPMPEDVQFSDNNRILEIYDLDIADEGTYYCTVARTMGAQVTAGKHLLVETKPYFVHPLHDQHADVDSQLTWRCEAKAVPGASYSWIKNGAPLVPGPGDIDITSNVLTIARLDVSRHEGMYQCVAQNTYGQSYSSAQLRVLAFKPTFAKRPLLTTSAAIGGEVTIVCSPEAAPKPEYTWTRNNINLNLQDGDTVSRVRKLANGNLYISNVQYADAGKYGCTATNSFGSDTSFGDLTIVSNTIITTPPSNTVGRINVTSVLQCRASFPGSLDSVYIWQFNGRDLHPENHPHYFLGTTGQPGALYITRAQYEHAGIYTCMAKTTFDVTNASATFTVQGPPGVPAGVRFDTASVTPTSVNVIWLTGDHHGHPVQFHVLEACTDFNKTWVPISEFIPFTATQVPGIDRHVYTATNLKPGNGYYFKVRAVNVLGVGHASRSSSMCRIPAAPPSIAPRNVGGGGGTVGTLTITWDPLPQDEQGGPGIGYIVGWRRKGTSTRFSQTTVAGNEGMYTVTIGTDNYYLLYEVNVTAFNNLGPGPSSSIVDIYSAEDMPMGVVTGIHAWPYNGTALEVGWDIVPNNRTYMRGTLLGYQVNYQLRGVEDASLDAISWRGETSSGIVIGLDPNTWYTVDVVVLNTAGMGPRSEVFHGKTRKQVKPWKQSTYSSPMVLPGMTDLKVIKGYVTPGSRVQDNDMGSTAPILYPTEVHVRSRSTTSVHITWRGISTGSDEENLEGYKVRYHQTGNDVRTATDIETDRETTEAVLEGIQKDMVYSCRVLGYSRGGDGKHSQIVYFTLGGLVAFDPSSSEIMSSASGYTVSLITFSTSLCAVFLYVY